MMDNPANPSRESKIVEVETACGSRVLLTPNTPKTLYRDETIYFCLPDCLESYQKDPLNSCMAARIFMDRG